jgi:hypothetical protein
MLRAVKRHGMVKLVVEHSGGWFGFGKCVLLGQKMDNYKWNVGIFTMSVR